MTWCLGDERDGVRTKVRTEKGDVTAIENARSAPRQPHAVAARGGENGKNGREE